MNWLTKERIRVELLLSMEFVLNKSGHGLILKDPNCELRIALWLCPASVTGRAIPIAYQHAGSTFTDRLGRTQYTASWPVYAFTDNDVLRHDHGQRSYLDTLDETVAVAKAVLPKEAWEKYQFQLELDE